MSDDVIFFDHSIMNYNRESLPAAGQGIKQQLFQFGCKVTAIPTTLDHNQ